MTQDDSGDKSGRLSSEEQDFSPWLLPASPNDSQELINSQTALLQTGKKPCDRESTCSNSNTSTDELPVKLSNCRKYIGVAILFLINLLNYMDRFTIAGVLIQIQDHFDIQHAMAGLLQTVFIISYMLFAPLFGYLGDRYNRKIIMIIGMVIWSGFTLLASFVRSPDLFPVFLMLRALVGIGEASYCTIAPTLIGDMFVGEMRTKMLSVFFLAIPFGSGLGYIVGSQVALAFGSWEWALRVTPAVGLLCIFLLAFFCPNPPRGACETTLKCDDSKHSYLGDLRYLMENKTFVLITLGFTFSAFVIGSLTLWGPVYFAYSQIAIGELEPCIGGSCDNGDVNFVFGLITCVAGIAGICIGAEAARRWKNAGNGAADPLVCAIGMILSAPFLLAGVQLPLVSLTAAWVCIFFANVCACLMWTLIGDMTLYVTLPDRRSTANAVMILTAHLFGDAGSPYLVGVLSDELTSARPDTYLDKCLAMRQAMYITLFACIIAGGGFLFASLYIVEDKENVDKFLKGSGSSASTRTTSSSDSKGSIPLKDQSPVTGAENGCVSSYVASPDRPNSIKCPRDSTRDENATESDRFSKELLVGGRETVI